MFNFNPFYPPKTENIQQKIFHLKATYPGLPCRELAKKLISEKCFWCALVGFISAIPAILPGIGTVIALVLGMVLDMTLFTYLLVNMVVEIAAVYGRDLTGENYHREVFWAFLLATGTGGLGKNLSRVAVTQMSKDAFISLTERMLVSFGIRITTHSTLARIIPFLGLFLAGGLNYRVAKMLGDRAIEYYENI
ncbi:MAG TPA: hypothetical protein DHV84_00530 [Desulfotomaculum sp.]|jgi:hypothetical protein|nr:hypothetical protein [Desulfotomaculum sp.]